MSDRRHPEPAAGSLKPNTPTPTAPASTTDAAPDDAERRAALAKLGSLAAWTTPTMLTLLVSRRASAESVPGPPDGFGPLRAPDGRLIPPDQRRY